jgi:catechol 2,3-dioxygenase-like lactoylglutathione lyase family enzyme
MVSRFAQLTLDVADVDAMALFWSQALGYRTVKDDDDKSAHLHPPADAEPNAPTFWLQNTGTSKAGKNRCHPDLVTSGDVDAEVERLIGLGARHANVGQTGTEGFVVLADPEGNEFCVLRR